MRRKKPQPKKKPNAFQAHLHLDASVLRLLEKLQGTLNEKLKAVRRNPLRTSQVLELIITDALVANAGDIQEESGALGLHRLAVRLAPLFGADGLATSGLPELPDGAGARRFNHYDIRH